MKVLSFILLIVTVLAVAPAQAQDTLTVNFSDPSRPGLLKITLVNGGMRIMGHPGKDVIVESSGPQRGRTRDGLRRIDTDVNGLSVEEENNVITITNRNFFNAGNLDIHVPLKTNLNLKTMNGGNISIEDVDGEIEVQNANGGVILNNVAGSVIAHSMNGRVQVNLRDISMNKPMSFISMNGNVDLTLPPSAKANLKMRADNGGTYSDFDILLTPSSSSSTNNGRFNIRTDRTLSGTINGGGPDIDLRTFNGSIYIRKGK
jgi:DUF4097 and DUF4098 domain-containing protein YvlB